MNRWDSIAIMIEISRGIYWPTLYLPNLSNSLQHQTMAHFIGSFDLFILKSMLLWAELDSAATTWPANVNKPQKMYFLPAKIVFMSKVLDSWSNDLQRFGRYKVRREIPCEVSIIMAIESRRFMYRKSDLIYIEKVEFLLCEKLKLFCMIHAHVCTLVVRRKRHFSRSHRHKES